MPRTLTPATSLENLKKEAKRWLKELRAGSAEARARLLRAYAKAPAEPVLRDVQHALAIEHGVAGWKELKLALERRVPTARAEDTRAQLVARFLEYACPDHHVRGRPAHRVARHAAMRLLEQHPEIARDSLYTAVVCGEIEEVERILRRQPELANARHPALGPDRSGGGGSYDFLGAMGSKRWEPLLYLCFTRLPLAAANENAVAIARLLLDHGADPNAYFMAGSSRYTPLTGVAGEGEENRPPHPRRDELARLLLERGAEPYDTQVIYDIHFHGKILWYVKLMYEFSVKAGRKADWDDPEWHMLDQGGYGSGARWHLWAAVKHNDLELAEWCLEHGANPNAGPASDPRLPQESLYELALRLGHVEMAELLARHGAERKEVALEGEDAFVAACMRLDRGEAQRILAQHPEYRRSPKAMFAAARQDRADVAALLLDLGTPIEVEDEKKQRPLHVAARADARRVAELLIERGAELDPYELNYNNTPLDFAVYAEHERMIELLRRHSRDVWNLAFIGAVERLREVLAAEPHRALVSWQTTPLFWLPEDESRALEIAKLFLKHGADAKFRSKEDGSTAAGVARKRGLHAVADLLEAAAGGVDEDAGREPGSVEHYEQLARDFVAAWDARDEAALQRLNRHYERRFTFDDLGAEIWRRVYAFRQRSSRVPQNYLALEEAQTVIANDAGYPSWSALTAALVTGAPPVPAYAIDRQESRIAPRRQLSGREWDELFAAMQEHRITALEAGGLMTDAVMARLAQLEHVTRLDLGGSRQLSDDGLRHLARMPQLQELNLSEYPGGQLSDRGLEVLRHLPNLRKFEMTWQRGISDAGIANLQYCEQLEEVNLMGSPTGDGAIAALRGKPKLRRFDTGRLVTDAGLAMLHDFPRFKSWRGGDDAAPGEPTHLLIDGPFTNRGLASLAGLEGVLALDLFWHVTGITSEGFAHLVHLPRLASLGCDGKLSDDAAMEHIAALPRLRMLRAQESVATDEGFVALSRSRTIESIWGRECPHFGSRGFVALSKMPALRGFGIGCKNVDDQALATLPQFPALRELTPIGFQDDGFRHIGRCERLERLTCMYCRETGDRATEHIAGLARLKYYYAGLTQITDRSLEILGGMSSLEQVEFYECKGITDAGLAFLAGLPRLRGVELAGLPGVTLEGTRVFPAQVRVKYSL